MTDLQHTTPGAGADATPGLGPPPVPPPAPPPAPPAMTPPAYPVEAAAPEPKKGRRWLMPLAVGFAALVVGAGIGVAASQPSMSSLKDDKAALQADVDSARADADQVRATLTATQSVRDTCRQATKDAKDLLDQQANFQSDFEAWYATAVGSAAEATWEQHMAEQQFLMQQQLVLVQSEIADCQAAIG
jgi:hypothetical protein